ncbi:MAG TPA: glycosyltransferase family 4 protein [Acidimicrobiales bacterium]|jgi:glycosyltransferase involved in cell wall biosynthesis|nr:glycosyltransferase family 4 protein [Acidimicrobiales bacterium]
MTTGILVNSYSGQPGVTELSLDSDAGRLPRKDYVEMWRRYGVEIIDSTYLARRGSPLSRAVARVAGVDLGQLCEAILGGGRYDSLWTWNESVGLPLALFNKVTRRQQDLVTVAAWLSRPKKAVFLHPLGAHSAIRAVVTGSRAQLDIAAGRLGVPRSKLHYAPWPVDERFWQPQEVAVEPMICAVGWEARDYITLLRAARRLAVDVCLAVGSHVLSWNEDDGGTAGGGRSRLQALRGTHGYEHYRSWLRHVADEGLPTNVSLLEQLAPPQLRDLYGRARLVVVPLHDVDSDCGITAIIEAMAMGKAVIVTRTRGQVDVFDDGVHGIYVPPYDSPALEAAINRLLADPQEAEKMGRAGRRLVESRHALDHYVDQLGALLV